MTTITLMLMPTMTHNVQISTCTCIREINFAFGSGDLDSGELKSCTNIFLPTYVIPKCMSFPQPHGQPSGFPLDVLSRK